MNDLIKSKLTFVDHQSEEKLLNYVWIYVELMFIIFEFYLMVVYRRIRKRVRRAKSNSEIRRDLNTFFKRWHINNRHCCWEKKTQHDIHSSMACVFFSYSTCFEFNICIERERERFMSTKLHMFAYRWIVHFYLCHVHTSHIYSYTHELTNLLIMTQTKFKQIHLFTG